MTRDEARQFVELRHGRKLFIDPVRASLTWGVAVPIALMALGKFGILPSWVGIISVLVCHWMGFNLFLDDWRMNRRMEAEVDALMKDPDPALV